MQNDFDREKHVYRNSEFAEILKDAVLFFHGTPVFAIPPPQTFVGAGVYALYYLGKSGIYSKFGNEINRTAYNVPIYVGKAVPDGWRQSRNTSATDGKNKLFSRIKEHARSIQAVRSLSVNEFHCRFMIFEGEAQNMIAAAEAALIAEKTPLWNSVVDGFGNHAPGVKRKTCCEWIVSKKLYNYPVTDEEIDNHSELLSVRRLILMRKNDKPLYFAIRGYSIETKATLEKLGYPGNKKHAAKTRYLLYKLQPISDAPPMINLAESRLLLGKGAGHR